MRHRATLTAIALVSLSSCLQVTTPEEAPELSGTAVEVSQAGLSQGPPAHTVFTPNTPSQHVACRPVDNTLARIPHGDAVAPVTDAETGPGGWRFSSGGGSFVTFAYEWNGAEYDVVAGRSRVGGNIGIINDYPAVLDLPQDDEPDRLSFKARHGEVVLSGGEDFQLPGQGTGQVRIPMSFVGEMSGARIYEGCASTPQLTNFGFTVAEGGDFVQREHFKAWASTDAEFQVTAYEWTEVSTFRNTDPQAN